ncbi:MAG: UDP-3-O-(3-hydroxymyristoyl)glucosamine N-acyltransferase, partial [Acidobacteriota bacterium]|nr:UDP-3-O-(3-hydroxymyristoyl)glucosamine N-acyltransferase [Acidobacteriota bacterium]
MKLARLAEQLGCELAGDPDIEIPGVAGLGEAEPGDLTFLANPRYRPAVRKTRAAAIVVAKNAGDMPLASLR